MAARRTAGRKKKGGTLGRVAAAAARQKGKTQWLRLDDGDEFTVRVVDVGEDFKDGYVHRVPMEKEDGERYYADVPCLDQDDKGIPCPGCKDDLQRRYKFWANVIVRDWEDESGNVADTMMVWSGGITVAKRLDKLDARFGLINRDVDVEREGKKKNDTKYEVEPSTDENEPLSDEDKELIANKKFDTTRYWTPPAFDDFYVPPGERDRDDDDDDEDVGSRSVKRGSAFKRRSKSSDDDEKPRTASRRRKPAEKKSSGTKLSGFNKGSSEGSAKKTTVRRRRSR